MGIFDRIKSVFEPEQETIEVKLQDMDSFISKIAVSKKNAIISDSWNKHFEIIKNLSELEKSLLRLRDKKSGDKRAYSSNKIKDQFCNKAVNKIRTIEKPKKDFDDIRRFVFNSQSVLSDINSITPRQVIHMDFFFKDDMQQLAINLKKLDRSIQEAILVLDLDTINKINYLSVIKNSVFDAISNVEEGKTAVENKKREIRETRERIGKLTELMEETDTSVLENLREEVFLLDAKLKEIKQELDSELGPLKRLFLKYKHYKNLDNTLLDMYVETPSRAFLADKKLLLKEILEEAVALHKDKELCLEKGKVDGAVSFLTGFDSFLELRKRFNETYMLLSEKKKSLNEISRSLIGKQTALRKEKEELEKSLDKLEKEIPEHEAEIELQKNKIKEKTHYLETQLSELFNKNVRIVL
jgi:peptidoglycan hydrolase CwlO-like protein